MAALLTGWEANAGPHTWRHVDEQTARYLTQMQTWGYSLADIERRAAGLDPTNPSDPDGAVIDEATPPPDDPDGQPAVA
ncbi:hypothetical protein [Pseudonocardia ailaonensis]|uniref:hypothetical protein n=1 Tax=Pseudonocardia ailaonensis TaxID=367279 RepID=UPI0031CE828F